MITREQVADLRAGDVVEIRSERWPLVVMRGPLHEERGWLSLGPWGVREPNGDPYLDLGNKSTRDLTVIERAPRLYVNHDRTEAVPGDVVRDADDEKCTQVWICLPIASWRPDELWVTQRGNDPHRMHRCALPDRLRLLVDGTTGQDVPVTHLTPPPRV